MTYFIPFSSVSIVDFELVIARLEVNLEPSQKSKMELFVKIVEALNGYWVLNTSVLLRQVIFKIYYMNFLGEKSKATALRKNN